MSNGIPIVDLMVLYAKLRRFYEHLQDADPSHTLRKEYGRAKAFDKIGDEGRQMAWSIIETTDKLVVGLANRHEMRLTEHQPAPGASRTANHTEPVQTSGDRD